jgi:hypothetical protein
MTPFRATVTVLGLGAAAMAASYFAFGEFGDTAPVVGMMLSIFFLGLILRKVLIRLGVPDDNDPPSVR